VITAGLVHLQQSFGPLDAFALPFMTKALITIAVLAVAAGIVGLFISLRDLEFMSDGLIHAVFPGLVIGSLVGGSAALLPGALVAALVAVVLLTVLERRGVGSDAAIAVVLTSLFSVGVVLVSRQQNYVSQLEALLFGRLLTVTETQLSQVVVVAALAIGVIALTWRAQLFRAFDPTGFTAAGFRASSTDLALGAAVALLVVAGVQALGTLMVLAILTVPMATARLLTRRLWLLIPIAILVPLLAGVLGLWISFISSVDAGVPVSPGAVVVLMLIAAYAIAVVVRLLASRLGWSRWFRSRQQRTAGTVEVAA
jgi:zinc/manganese transport system permease protein